MKTLTDTDTYLNSLISNIEDHLKTLLSIKNSNQNALYEAAQYSTLGGGKRLRPLLTLITTELLGGELSKAITSACALELIHAYSLIHDDLPCMDDDDYRRGIPTLHKKFTEGHAVLTGDFLLTYAFEVIANDSNLDNTQRVRLIQTLCKYAGSEGMIGGQVLDIESEGKKIDLKKLELIHRCKTAALITAAIEFGGIIANTSDDNMKLLTKFGTEIGLAFQIVDDVIDVISSDEKHGKKVSSDLTNQKTTYVSLLGIEKSKEMAQKYFTSACENLKQLPGDKTHILLLANKLVNRKI